MTNNNKVLILNVIVLAFFMIFSLVLEGGPILLLFITPLLSVINLVLGGVSGLILKDKSKAKAYLLGALVVPLIGVSMCWGSLSISEVMSF